MADEASAQRKRMHDKKLSVITVGSGVPGPSSTRAEAMTVIRHDDRYIVMDCGYATVNRLMKRNIDLGKIDTIMFTHFHLDHSCDFFSLMTYRYLSGGKALDIIGPPGTKKYYDFYKSFYRDDIIYRAQVYDINSSSGVFKDVKVHELKGGKKINLNGIAIESAELVHVMYNLGYKFHIGDKTVVVSGDTSYTNKLVQLAKGVDMLVLDGSWIIHAQSPANIKDGTQSNWQNSGLRKIDGEIPKPVKYRGNFTAESHFSYNDNIKTVGEIKPKKLIFTHRFSTFSGNTNPLSKDVKERIESDLKEAGYTGEVYYAEDNLEVDV
jgi:ribonuclease BN (tRNA processing enzyme)